MKTWRAVTIASAVVLGLGLAMILSTPLRFPGFIILPFGPVFTFLIPAFVTCALLALRLVLPHRTFAATLLVAGIGYLLLEIVGAMPPVVLVPSLGVLAVMYLVSKCLQPPQGDAGPTDIPGVG
jgi:hypothetical protein